MTIVHRYLLKSLSRYFGLIILALVILSGFIDSIFLFKNPEARISFTYLLKLNWYALPFHLYLVIPLALFLAALLTVATLETHHEITSMIIAGIHFFQIFPVIAGFSVAVYMIGFINLNLILPRSFPVMNQLKEQRTAVPESAIDSLNYRSPDNRSYYIERFRPDDGSIAGIHISDNSKREAMNTYQAVKGFYRDQRWVMAEVVKRTVSKTETMKEQKLAFYFDQSLPPPDVLIKRHQISTRSKEEISVFVLWQVLPYSHTSLQLYRKIMIDLWEKILFIIDYLLLGTLGLTMGMYRKNIRMYSSGQTGIGILLFLLYSVVTRYGYSLGYEGVLPYYLAASCGITLLALFLSVFIYKNRILISVPFSFVR